MWFGIGSYGLSRMGSEVPVVWSPVRRDLPVEGEQRYLKVLGQSPEPIRLFRGVKAGFRKRCRITWAPSTLKRTGAWTSPPRLFP